MKEKNENKKRPKDFTMRMFKRILAGIIVLIMLGAVLYTPLYLLINR